MAYVAGIGRPRSATDVRACLLTSSVGHDLGMSLPDRSGRIDRNAPVHIWRQVANDLAADIESGEIPRGARLPSEVELASQYGVSRISVRTAIRELAEHGLVVVVRGRGTYVTPRAP